jgi:cyclic beta-1,2-glucan synthetase
MAVEGAGHHLALVIIFGLIAIASASQLAVSLVNFLSTLIVKPALLPKMDFSKGIPVECKTLVAVPSMLINEREIDSLIESLEIRYLANKQEYLYFALLTDFKDAPQEKMPEDDELVNMAIDKITALNHKYATSEKNIFFLMHRPRRWNESERKWMGYERKRGKLADLNDLLRGEGRAAFSNIIGDLDQLLTVKYVISLDSDTVLPRDAAAKMVATIAHPLNKAVYDEAKHRVVKGYGILQPRVAVSMPRLDTSAYAKLNGNEPGIDPYTRAISDVYQDVFGEGSYIGKGIYEVDIFEKSLKNRFPENRVLSHDLLEGSYVRAGLISDVQLYEKYPARYSADMKRRDRWIRGDWQIARWTTPWVPDINNKSQPNPISALSRWKIFDNIRRSIFPVAITLLILLGWILLPESGWWTLIVSGLVILPPIIVTGWNIVMKPKDVIFWHHLVLTSRSAGDTAITTIFTLICLPYEAFLNVDAIVRTCWRMWFSHKNLLEWNPSGMVELSGSNQLWSSYLTMILEPLVAVAVGIYLADMSYEKLFVAGPILLLWILAPAITWRVSQPLPKKSAELSPEQKIFLQKSARKTWQFFADLVNEGENWLPPDNMQEMPKPMIAHRTSPTNIGLALLGNLSAYDFGYISQSELLDRTEKTFASLHKMERCRGHFYNWYDTQSLQPLLPRYISTVDSGNLSGHLLTLRQGILALPHQQIITGGFFDGLRTTLRLLSDNIDKTEFSKLRQFKIDVENIGHAQQPDLLDIKNYLETLSISCDTIIKHLYTPPYSEAGYWKNILCAQIAEGLRDFKEIVPWIFLPMSEEDTAVIKSYGLPTLHGLKKLHIQLSGKTNVAEADTEIDKRLSEIAKLAHACYDLADAEWLFLYDERKQLLSIGYNVDEHRMDNSYYDLLASESRLTIFLAIAQGKIPQESWFALGRHLVDVDGNPVLLSWSGSMFEYLMPLLVMPTYTNTLLHETNISCVAKQISHGKQRGVYWGTSESCYNLLDAAQNYQYKAFGVPGLGLKRGLGEDLVVAPYASVLALMVASEKSCQNLQQLADAGFEGKYGFYESIDYTASRLQRGQSYATIQSFMSHHQGMSLLSYTYLLLGQPMQRRFEADPTFNATLLLLEERIPKTTSFYVHTTDVADMHGIPSESEIRIIRTPHTPVPEVQLLSNGNYHVMVTNAGGGYSQWKGNAITRWREDATRDNWGIFCYIRDLGTGNYWSTAHQPTLQKGAKYEVAFSQGRADFKDQQNGIEMHTELVVSPEDDIEMRRVHITNRSGRKKTIDVTSYAEVVIAPMSDDLSHTSFSNLFVETELVQGQHAIICRRRQRSPEEKFPVMFHLMKIHGKKEEEVSYETDRLKFIGRTNTPMNPQAMTTSGKLANSEGTVLDPIVSIRYKITLEADESVILDLLVGAADTREICQGLIDKYQDKHHKDRVFELAWTHSQVVLHQINASEAEAQLYNRIAGSVLYINPALRADASVLVKNHRGQGGLWPFSISGDLPIVFISVEDQSNIEIVRQLIQAHSYWRLKGLAVDLVIWNESHGGYRQNLQNQILGLTGGVTDEKPGGVFIRSADQISNEDRILLQTVARISITGHQGNLQDYINGKTTPRFNIPYLVPSQSPLPLAQAIIAPAKKELRFDNKIGGFNQSGDEYIITVDDKNVTPSPWVNVLTNPNFGTLISESGQAYTWSENAHEFRLTPWNNDPVSDTGGEVFYIRDEETGHFWSVTPLPLTSHQPYTIRHGFGYSVFEHTEDGIQSELTVYVDAEATIKFSAIKLKNISGRQRKMTVTGYTEWVLGDLKQKSSMYVTTEPDAETGTLFTKNTYSTEFSEVVAFFDTDDINKTFTGSRTEFIGRNRSLQNPEALSRLRLSGKKGIGVDPCAALQVNIELTVGQQRDVVFKLGTGKNFNEAKNLVKRFRGRDKSIEALDKVKAFWKKILSTIQVQTPDKSVDLMANGWLLYQTLACRMWGRTGFYQSSGAFGFRDQLQDSMAVIQALPDVTRRQIILFASKQFKEGDVMHWWHPPVGRGVRTHCSDDFLWLPYVVHCYVRSTGDRGILQEQIPFLEGRFLTLEEESHYDLPAVSHESGTIYEHCVRAIRNGMKYGAHGLPLMGRGDWNDGMDRVGILGKGESVWLGFFLLGILKDFGSIAGEQNDKTFAKVCEDEAARLQENIESHGWDGDWYLRAFFDDGSPLGAARNEECKIDSIAQSWAVISGSSNGDRSRIAMDSAYKYLVTEEGNIRLLYPPFDKSSPDPGYIKGYVPGVRENGGQYTHAAAWFIIAFAKLGQTDRAWELFSRINPINHALDYEAAQLYKGEPYVMAGDVYTQTHAGQAGWTWYTGSAGWMYGLLVEELIGIKLVNGKLHLDPRVPDTWETFSVNYSFGNTQYKITYSRDKETHQNIHILDGQTQPGQDIYLADDGADHIIEVRISSMPKNNLAPGFIKTV